MEDPWGSPWTADSPPKLDLPAPPPHAHFSTDHTHHGNSGSRNGGSPQKISPNLTPWEEDDAWGGWNEPGKESPWGRSPGLKPLESAASTRLPSPAPGAGLEAWGGFGVVETRRREDQNTDSGISLGERGRSGNKTKETQLNAEDVWGTADPDPEPTSNSESLSPPTSPDDARSTSPEGAPKLALAPGTRPEAVRQSSKVQELVQLFDGIARTQSVSPSPIEPPKGVVGGTSLSESSKEAEPVESETKDEEESMGDFQENLEVGSESEAEVSLDEDTLKTAEEPKAAVILANIVEKQAPIHEESKPENPPMEDPWAQPGDEQPSTSPGEPTQELNKDPWTEDGIEQPLPIMIEADGKLHMEEKWEEPDHEQASALTKLADQEPPEAASWTNGHLEQVDINPVSETSSQEAPSKGPTLRPLKGPKTPYPIDMSKLDDLFPSVDASFPAPEPIPDVIIDDTFASISERKAWYRTSRSGSIRQHNLGDDENYVRISWGNSQIREQGIRIVRRWMEEDSIGGRVVLGRRTGAAGSKIFNWDSSAPQVEISELFGRKSHSRQASTVSKDTARTPASPSAAAFGWSSTSSPTIAFPPPAPDSLPRAEHASTTKSPVTALSSLQPVSRPVSIIQASPISPLAQPPITAESDNADDSEDDDDDWGEMISSPAGVTNGDFPPLADVVDAGMATKGTGMDRPTLPVPASKPAPVEQAEEDWGGKDQFTTSAAPAPANNSKQNNPPDSWDFGNMDFLGGASEVAPARHVPLPTPTPPPIMKPAEPFIPSKPITKPLSPVSLPSPQNITKPPSPISLSSPQVPPQPPKIDTSKDDEIVVKILRDLPDLSYILR